MLISEVPDLINYFRTLPLSGEYFYHMQKRRPLPATRDISTQDRLLDFCSRATGVELRS
jgi:hypothetical protein